MSIEIRAFANADDAFVLWRPSVFYPDWVGFALDRQDRRTNAVTPINNRIPAKPGAHAQDVPNGGVSSSDSPIRRCAWMDHGLNEGDEVRYRVTPISQTGAQFTRLDAVSSDWSEWVHASAEGEDGLAAYFNRGMLMSQIVSRLVDGDVTSARLKALVKTLADPGAPARRYLAGQARHALLDFLAKADARGSQIHAALYEVNDPELIAALKAFKGRGHVLLGNGGATPDDLGDALVQAGLDVHHRDLSHRGESSPSVHNKFVVETDPHAGPVRVLTGSTNWTVTGLCTQLNNVLVLPSAPVAARFRDQWTQLVAAGDDMPEALKHHNAQPTVDRKVNVTFAASNGAPDLATVEAMIRQARHGCLFLMFMPGQSPLLEALLERSRAADIYVRGMVSRVTTTATGAISSHDVTVISAGETGAFREDILLPEGVSEPPSWAREEFTRNAMFGAGLQAIVHSKTIVIDPFSDDPIVVTGSHNFSTAASRNNDENLVIVRGDRALAQRYAVHIQGVYDAFAWRAFLRSSGDSDRIYTGLERWMSGPKRRELDFWFGRAGEIHASAEIDLDAFRLSGDPDWDDAIPEHDAGLIADAPAPMDLSGKPDFG